MEPGREKRRLAAILAADMVAYARLMEADESGTLARLKAHRTELIDPAIQKNNGRIIKTTGDGMLVEFASVVDAVQCAAEIQRRMARRNSDMAQDRRIDFRIGINLGDIIVEDEDVYGDGVNIAARLETLAEPGGICLSGPAYDQLKAKLDLGYADLGEKKLKNISEPVRVYRVELGEDGTGAPRISSPAGRWRWVAAAVAVVLIAGAGTWAWDNWWRLERVEAASLDRMAYPLPDRPSIAVLPFDNLTGDPEQEILIDGLVEEIITALSKLGEIFVIARNSTFTYKGKPVKVQQVAEELGVRYVVEGSVQMQGERLRVTAQLIDALSGRHVWADRYDRDPTEVFAVRDEITLNIVSEIGAALEVGEMDRVTRRETDSLEAWLLYREGHTKVARIRQEETIPAKILLERAIEIDPGFVSAYARLAAAYRMHGQYWPADRPPDEYYEHALELIDKALALDDSHALTYASLSGIHIARREFDQAVEAAERAVALDPNNWLNQGYLGWVYQKSVRPQESIRRLKLAMRLSPFYPPWVLNVLARSHFLNGDTEQALELFKKALTRVPAGAGAGRAHSYLALIYDEQGQEDEARAEVAMAVDVFPQMSISYFKVSEPLKDTAFYEEWGQIWRRLGMPE